MIHLGVCVFTCIERVSAQFGSRGVVKLPDGWVYHDNQTLDASKNAARFALHQQHRQELIIIRMNGGAKKDRVATRSSKILEERFVTRLGTRINRPLH